MTTLLGLDEGVELVKPQSLQETSPCRIYNRFGAHFKPEPALNHPTQVDNYVKLRKNKNTMDNCRFVGKTL